LLSEAGVQGIEVAPTRFWPGWHGASAEAASLEKRRLAAEGFRVSSLQAILFGQPELRLFGSDRDREALFEHLVLCADLAIGLAAEQLVFGAPKNRGLCGRSPDDAFRIAREFFRRAGCYYAARGLCLCLEPNPRQYVCDFAVDSSEAAALVYDVDSPGFGLHLDTGCLYLAGEDPAEAIRNHSGILRHFHVSEPFLAGLDSRVVDHKPVFEALEAICYRGWVALEMRAATNPLAGLANAVNIFVGAYRPLEVA
jgi:sugar phosphate isomerase/epimerase